MVREWAAEAFSGAAHGYLHLGVGGAEGVLGFDGPDLKNLNPFPEQTLRGCHVQRAGDADSVLDVRVSRLPSTRCGCRGWK